MTDIPSNLDELKRDPKAAALLKNRELLQSLLSSPDTRRLMELLGRNGGAELKTAAARGDTKTLAGMVRQVMDTREGAALVEKLEVTSRTTIREKLLTYLARQAEAAQEGESQPPQKDGEEEDLGDTTRIDFGELQFGRDYEIK